MTGEMKLLISAALLVLICEVGADPTDLQTSTGSVSLSGTPAPTPSGTPAPTRSSTASISISRTPSSSPTQAKNARPALSLSTGSYGGPSTLFIDAVDDPAALEASVRPLIADGVSSSVITINDADFDEYFRSLVVSVPQCQFTGGVSGSSTIYFRLGLDRTRLLTGVNRKILDVTWSEAAAPSRCSLTVTAVTAPGSGSSGNNAVLGWSNDEAKSVIMAVNASLSGALKPLGLPQYSFDLNLTITDSHSLADPGRGIYDASGWVVLTSAFSYYSSPPVSSLVVVSPDASFSSQTSRLSVTEGDAPVAAFPSLDLSLPADAQQARALKSRLRRDVVQTIRW